MLVQEVVQEIVAAHLVFGLAEGDTVAQAADQVEEVAAAVGGRGVQLKGEPEFGWVELAGREGEAGRHDADHRAGFAVQVDVSPDGSGRSAEALAPQAVADDCHARRARLVVLSR